MAFRSHGTPFSTLFATATTSHVVSLDDPEGAPQLGDGLLCLFIANRPPSEANINITAPDSWQTLDTQDYNGTGLAKIDFGIYYKNFCSGNEAAEGVDFVTDVASVGVAIVIRIPAWLTRFSRVGGGAISSSNTATPDPPTINPAWTVSAADDLLVIAGTAHFHTSNDFAETTYPTNYTDGFSAGTMGVTGGIEIAFREVNAQSEDPGTFGLNSGGSADTERQIPFTIAFGSKPTYTLDSGGYSVYNATTDTVLASSNQTALSGVYSCIKVLSALVLSDAKPLAADLEETRVIVADDQVGGSGDNLTTGWEVELGELLHDSINQSSNSATIAYAAQIGAESLGGSPTHAASITEFVSLMQAKATAIGLPDFSTIDSPDGFTDPSNLSARDLAILATVGADDPHLPEVWTKFRHVMQIEGDGAGSPTTQLLLKGTETAEIFPYQSVPTWGVKGGGGVTLSALMMQWNTPSGANIGIAITDGTDLDTIFDDAYLIIGDLLTNHPELLSTGADHSLTPDSVTAGAPGIDSPALSQVHSLAPDDVSTGAPSLDSPALSQAHGLVPDDVSVGAPAVDAPALSQVHALTPDDVAAGAPALDSPALFQVHALSPDDVLTGAPAIDSPALDPDVGAPDHSLTPDDISTGAPGLDSPALSQVHGLVAEDVATAAPSLDSPALSQIHALAADDVTTGAPAIDSPVLSPDVGSPDHSLTPSDLIAGAPSLSSPALSQVHTLTVMDVIAGAPSIDAAALSQIYALVPVDLFTGAPILSSPALGPGGTFSIIDTVELTGTLQLTVQLTGRLN